MVKFAGAMLKFRSRWVALSLGHTWILRDVDDATRIQQLPPFMDFDQVGEENLLNKTYLGCDIGGANNVTGFYLLAIFPVFALLIV